MALVPALPFQHTRGVNVGGRRGGGRVGGGVGGVGGLNCAVIKTDRDLFRGAIVNTSA